MSETQFTSFTDWFADRRIASSAGFFLPHIQPGMTLLDVGCGPGSITLDFAEALAPAEVVAIDIDPEMLGRARATAEQRGVKNVRFEEGDIHDLKFPAGSFDAVWTSSVMQWIDRPDKAAREIKRVLKPGGVYASRDRANRGDIFGNSNPLVLRARRLHYRLVEKYGFSALIAERLRGVLLRVGFTNVTTTASYESRGTQEGARFMANLYKVHVEDEPAVDEIVGYGWATREELKSMVEAWNAWGEDPYSYYCLARVETVAWKPK
jgi:ubiquinone/menaquinone biosynthesis C-methylase UbiE